MSMSGVRKSQKKQERMVAAWNQKYPVGTRVSVRKDDGSILQTVTRDAAWMLSGHTAVILVEGIAGAYMLERVSAV